TRVSAVLEGRLVKPLTKPPELKPGMVAQLEHAGVTGVLRAEPYEDAPTPRLRRRFGQKLLFTWRTDEVPGYGVPAQRPVGGAHGRTGLEAEGGGRARGRGRAAGEPRQRQGRGGRALAAPAQPQLSRGPDASEAERRPSRRRDQRATRGVDG